MLNSGIKDDASIMADLASMQNKPNYNDSLMIANKAPSRQTGVPAGRQSKFCNMVRQRTIRH